ncbi:MAG: AMP-binding protein [Opitutales bacterium]|nr:AMP-binding protein [Opitutales bacterium]
MASDPKPILDSGMEAFAENPRLKGHLADLVVRNLTAHPLRKIIVDRSRDRVELSGGMLLAAALALSEQWKELTPERRVGVVFPSGLGGVLTNLSLTVLDKVPVNLNFTMGSDAIESCIERSEIRNVITAKPVIDKVPDFPWPKATHDLLKVRAKLSKKRILWNFLRILALPGGLVCRQFGIPNKGGNREAGLLFSSGSTGMPKGIPLSHSNIIANCEQIRACHLLDSQHTLMAFLPLFHSFGFTVTLWYPLVSGLKTVMLPSPLETKRIAEAIEEEKATVMMGTPTFFRPFFKRVEPKQIKSLEYIVGGAEKTPPGFAEKWEETFGSSYLEGYGLTETSPVVSANLPAMGDRPARTRAGSVGPLMAGMQARVTDVSSSKPLSVNESGILELKGPNVFKGYLDDPDSTEAAFHDGWFSTGDLASIDEDGYIFIKGRLSRFSKLGGEMVPHGRIEQIIAECFDLEDADTPMVAVTGIEDEQKGEALVVLSTVEITPAQIRERLTARKVPNLWIPRIVQRVDAIPCLASGKLDLQGLARLARSAKGDSGK